MEEKEQVVVENQEPVESKEIDYAAELKKLQEAQSEYQKRFDEQKEILKKRDSTISKLSKEKEEAELAKLSESERAEAERAKAIEEAEAIRKETATLRRERDLTKVLFEKSLDPELFSGRILGDSIEDMQADAEKLEVAINKEVESRVEKEITARLGGKKPEGGKESGNLSFAEQVARAQRISSGRRSY
jgi:hypothetical protein